MEHVREELDRLIQQRRLGYSSISRMIGRNSSYIQQFIKRGSPRKLDDDDRRTLASFFGVDEQVLGGPPAPMRDGLIEIPVLNVDASAGFGAIAESETAHTRFGFDERWLARLTRAKSASLSIIHVLGDSMEPTLSDGDEVLVDARAQGVQLRVDGLLPVGHVGVQPCVEGSCRPQTSEQLRGETSATLPGLAATRESGLVLILELCT